MESIPGPHSGPAVVKLVFTTMFLVQLSMALLMLVENQLARLSKKQLRLLRRNRGVGSGRGQRRPANSLPARDCCADWRFHPRMFLFTFGFYPDDFDVLVKEVAPTLAMPRPRRGCGPAPAKTTTSPGKPRKLSIDNEVSAEPTRSVH